MNSAKPVFILIFAIAITWVIKIFIDTGTNSNSVAKNYFAIMETSNSENNAITVTIHKSELQNDCNSLLQGSIAGADQSPLVKVNSSKCVTTLPPQYEDAFKNKPIKGVLYVGYKNVIWPSRVLMYKVDQSWLSEEGCVHFTKLYQAVDESAFCVFGER